MTLKTIGHLFYATSSSMHHFIAIGEFKLELQSRNPQSGSNSMIFRAVRPWNLTNDLAKQYSTSSMLLQALCIISYPLVNNKANLRDLIAATGLVISNWIQIVNFSARVTVKFDGWPCKTIGHLFYATSSFVHLFVPIGEFKLKLQSGNAQSGSNSTIFRAVRPWNLTDDLEKQ